MKRSFLLSSTLFPVAATALIAATYGLVRLSWGLLLPDMQSDLGFGAAAAGLVSALASVMYCIGALAGFLAAAGHPRALVVAAGASAGVGAIGMALAPQTIVLAGFAVIGSAGAGLASPALVALLQRNVRADRITRMQSIVNSGTGPGLVVAGLVALVLLPDWRTAWLVAGVVGVAAAASVLVLDRGGVADPSAGAVVPPSAWWRAHVRVVVASVLLGAGSAAVWNDGRTVLVDAGSPTTSVLAWIALGVGGAAVVATARWTASLRPAAAWTIASAAAGCGTAALIVSPGVLPAAIAASLAFGWGYTAASGALITWTAEIDADRAASGTALLFVLLVLGQAVGAGSIGVLLGTVGATPAFLAAAAACGFAAVLGLVRRPARRRAVSAAR